MARLYIVPTPIGNLDDITLRAVRVLREVDFILAEDTRTTSFLLRHLGIEKKLYSHHKFNEHATVEMVAGAIAAGRNAALVSDAGTPGISDPGFLLVRTCVEAGIEVETLPGATALIPALVQSGFPCDRFCFEGFLPQKKGRVKQLQTLADEERTMIFYESPYRVVKCLEQFAEVFGPERGVSVSRELTKKFEQTVRGTAAEVLEHFRRTEPRGEFVLILEGAPDEPETEQDEAERLASAAEAVRRRIAAQLDDDALCARADFTLVNILEEELEPNVSLLDRRFRHEAQHAGH